MVDKEKPKTANENVATTQKIVFSLERLRRDCAKLFGVTSSTFDGATRNLTGDFTVEDVRKIIQAWQNKRVKPAIRKERK